MRILGIDPLADPVAVKRRIGVVPEDLALFERLTAPETLTFVAEVHGLEAATARDRASDLLELMDLKAAGTTLVTDFSHGMRKKLSLAAALLPAPKLLFLDEPFEGIDAVASRQIKDLLHSFVTPRRHHLPHLAHPRDRRAALDPHRRHRQGPARRAGHDRRSFARDRRAVTAAPSESGRALHRASSAATNARRSRSTGFDACSESCARSPGCGGACCVNSLEHTGGARHARAPVGRGRADRADHRARRCSSRRPSASPASAATPATGSRPASR